MTRPKPPELPPAKYRWPGGEEDTPENHLWMVFKYNFGVILGVPMMAVALIVLAIRSIQALWGGG